MSPIAYLVIAVVVGLVGIAVVVAMNRTPRRPDFAMEAFRREMQALAPPGQADEPRPTSDLSGVQRVGPETEPEAQ